MVKERDTLYNYKKVFKIYNNIIFRYRCCPSGSFDEIIGVTSGYYQPNADDIGSKICARIVNVDDEAMQSFAQLGTLECCKNLYLILYIL